jgi:hypothetical protein
MYADISDYSELELTGPGYVIKMCFRNDGGENNAL